MEKWKILTKGILKENPSFVLVLGTCPTLAVTTMAMNGVGMGLAVTFVLMCSNMVISMLKSIIPDHMRIPCYIVVIAGFVTIVDLLMQAYLPALNDALGIYIPLIVVNCIILGRAEVFAGKNGVFASALDGIGMGLGFTLALVLIGSVREILSAGTWFGLSVAGGMTPIAFFGIPAGGFLTFGFVIALVNYITKSTPKMRRKKAGVHCNGCDGCESCEGGCKQ